MSDLAILCALDLNQANFAVDAPKSGITAAVGTIVAEARILPLLKDRHMRSAISRLSPGSTVSKDLLGSTAASRTAG